MLSKRIAWILVICLAVSTLVLAFQRYRLRLLDDDFRYKDEFRQRALDAIESRDVELQGRLNYARTREVLSQIKVIVLATTSNDAPRAAAAIAWDMGTHRGIIKTLNLPAAPADRDYQLWIYGPDNQQPAISAGVFDATKDTSEFQPAKPIDSTVRFTVTVELKGGAPAPHGPMIMEGG